VLSKGNGKAALAWQCLRQLLLELWGTKPDSQEEQRILAGIERCQVAMVAAEREEHGREG